MLTALNPFNAKSDQSQIFPAASLEILHHTARRAWLFIVYSDKRLLYYQFSLPHLYISPETGWDKAFFVNLGVKG